MATIDIETITIHIPVAFKRRGGRKLVLSPDGSPVAPVQAEAPEVDDTLKAAVIKAHRWRRRIESGRAASITDLAGQEKVTDSYVLRLLALTCLAPDITAAILNGRHPRGLTLNAMLKKVPEGWDEQRTLWEFPGAR
ncbi:MAG: hypothetical protein ABT940_07280 [Alphaproteobacteria bacterium]